MLVVHHRGQVFSLPNIYDRYPFHHAFLHYPIIATFYALGTNPFVATQNLPSVISCVIIKW
jgi:hypothetical protein